VPSVILLALFKNETSTHAETNPSSWQRERRTVHKQLESTPGAFQLPENPQLLPHGTPLASTLFVPV
jgi:hypothetical protein